MLSNPKTEAKRLADHGPVIYSAASLERPNNNRAAEPTMMLEGEALQLALGGESACTQQYHFIYARRTITVLPSNLEYSTYGGLPKVNYLRWPT